MAEDDYKLPGFVSFTKKWHNKPYDFISPTRPELSAAGKNVIITGGGTGIGKAIATAFAQAGAASVSILGRRLAPLESASKDIQKEGPNTKVFYEQGDLTVLESISAAVKSLADKAGGKVDILVSCAGSNPHTYKSSDYPAAELEYMFKLNVISALNAIQAFLPVAASDAKVFNISSGIGHMQPMPTTLGYSLTKAAGIKLFDYFAWENPNIHVVQVQPGVVATDINKDLGETGQDTPDLPGNFLVWLASPEAAFLKGRYVWVNWDAEELISKAEEIKKDPLLLKVYLSGVPM